MNTDPQRSCPHCGKPLATDGPQDVCAGCLLKAGLDTEAGQAGPRFAPPPLRDLAQQFPSLEILEFIGQGGMGAVYKARQKSLNRLVALKILAPEHERDVAFSERFTREAQALARLNHPGIVAIYEFGQVPQSGTGIPPAPSESSVAAASGTGGTPALICYFLMEFVEGLNLREIQSAGRLAPAKALQIVPQICDALQYAHDEGVVHRDIKPENILLDTRGRVKITDFGIAKIVGAGDREGITGAKEVIGTPHYMAPEQVEKPLEVDHRADIFSLGVVLYELLTGELPLGRFAPPSRKVRIDLRLDEVVMRALEKEPSRRYQHASQVKCDVETITTTSPSTPPVAALGKSMGGSAPNPPPRLTTSTGGNHRGWLIAVLAGAAFLLLATLVTIGLVVYSLRPGKPVQTTADSMPAGTPRSSPAWEMNPPWRAPAAPPRHPTRNVPAPAPVPAEPREPRDLSAADLDDVLLDLKSSQWGPRQAAVHKLAWAKPGDRRDEVVASLVTVLKDSEWGVRQGAARALGVWGSTNVVASLIQSLEDPEFSVRWAAMNSLGVLKDPRAAVPLARRFNNEQDIMIASNALQALGSAAEDALVPLLEDKSTRIRQEACQALNKIGTEKSISALKTACADSDPIVAMMARSALQAARARQSPSPSASTNQSSHTQTTQ